MAKKTKSLSSGRKENTQSTRQVRKSQEAAGWQTLNRRLEEARNKFAPGMSQGCFEEVLCAGIKSLRREFSALNLVIPDDYEKYVVEGQICNLTHLRKAHLHEIPVGIVMTRVALAMHRSLQKYANEHPGECHGWQSDHVLMAAVRSDLSNMSGDSLLCLVDLFGPILMDLRKKYSLHHSYKEFFRLRDEERRACREAIEFKIAMQVS